jgi:hypothetical protein
VCFAQLSRPRSYEASLSSANAREESALAECTFKPMTGRAPYAHHSASAAASSSSSPADARAAAAQRLHAEAEARYAAREAAKRRMEDAELRALTFMPRVNPVDPSSDAVAQRPLYERVADLIRARDAARAAAAAAAEEEMREKECTFVPRVDANSERIAAALRAAGEMPVRVLDRLAAGETSAVGGRLAASARAAALGAAADADAAGGYTFAPKLSANSERIVASMDAAGRPGDFVQRQAAYAAASERRRAAAAATDDADCTFSPDVASAEEVLARSRHAARLGETGGERDARLADARRKESLRRSLEAGLYGAAALPFAPALSAGTRRMAPVGTPLEELVADTRRERVRAAAAAAAEATRAAECTFRPNTSSAGSSSSSLLASSSSASERAPRRSGSASRVRLPPSAMFASDANGAAAKIRDFNLEKEVRAERERAAKEAAELAACTFWPEVHRARPRSASPVVVRGLGTFMQKHAAATRLKEEAAERARRAFVLDAPSRPPRAPFTIPRPFGAMEARAAEAEARRAALLERAAAEQAAKHPFRPATRETANREMLRRIMAADDGDDAYAHGGGARNTM